MLDLLIGEILFFLCECLCVFYDCLFGKIVGTTFSFDEVGAGSRYHIDWLHWSKWQSKSVIIVITINLATFDMSESWLVELVILFLHFWDSIKVPRYLVAGRTWLFALFILSRLVRII